MLIDYVLTNNPTRVQCEALQNEKITDHETISIKINKEKLEVNSHDYVLSWANYNKISLIKKFKKLCDWSNFEQSKIDIKLEILPTNLSSFVSSLTNLVKININEAKKVVWPRVERIKKWKKW